MKTSVRIFAVLSFFLFGFGAILVAQERSRQGGPPGSFQGQTTQATPGQVTQGQVPSGGGRPQWQGSQGQGGPPQRMMPGGGQPPWGGGGASQPGGSGGRGGGPPGTPGGPPGGGANVADRNARMVEMFRSMDANRNGILEPSEIPDSRRGFVTAIATRFGVDPNRPINLADLERRAAASASTQPGGAPPASSNTGRSDRSETRSESGGSGRSSATPAAEPLVPPFGEQKPVETPVPTFGQRLVSATPSAVATRSSGRVMPNQQPQPAQAAPAAIKQSAAYDRLPSGVRNNPVLDWFFAYDKDMDAQLTMQEYVNGLGGVWTEKIANEFQFLDKNGDGLATIDEVLAFLKDYDDLKQTAEPGGTGTPTVAPMVQPSSSQQAPPLESRRDSSTNTASPTPGNQPASPWANRGGSPPSSGNASYSRGTSDQNRSGSTGRPTSSRPGNARGGGR